MSLLEITSQAISKVSSNIMFIAQMGCDLRTNNRKSIFTLTSAADWETLVVVDIKVAILPKRLA